MERIKPLCPISEGDTEKVDSLSFKEAHSLSFDMSKLHEAKRSDFDTFFLFCSVLLGFEVVEKRQKKH